MPDLYRHKIIWFTDNLKILFICYSYEKAQLYFTLLYFTAPAFAQEAPLWLSHKSVKYPDTLFISALGSGASEAQAKEDAVTQLALYFNSTITVNHEVSGTITESSTIEKSRSASSSLIIDSETDLPLLTFTESFCDNAGEWHICTYINRDDAVKRCAAELGSGIQKAKNALKDCKNAGISVSAFTGFSKLKEYLSKLQKTRETLTVLNAEKSKSYQAEIDAIEHECNAGIRTIKPRLSFNIKIENDENGSIAAVLREILEKEGFVCGEQAALLISGKLIMARSENDAGVFVRPNLALKILNRRGDVLYSYSRQYKKWGHRDFDSAVRKAYAEIDKDLRADFMNVFK